MLLKFVTCMCCLGYYRWHCTVGKLQIMVLVPHHKTLLFPSLPFHYECFVCTVTNVSNNMNNTSLKR